MTIVALPFCTWLAALDCPPADTTQVIPPQDNWNIPHQNNWQGLEILTWNVKQFPLSSNTVSYAAEVISDLLPDVVNLQEITDLNDLNTLAVLLPAYDFISTDYEASGGFGLDLAMAVRSDCVSIQEYTTLFPGDGYEFAYRYPLSAILNWGCGDAALSFQMVNVHFKCCDDGFERRLAASQILRDYIYNMVNSGGYENIIVAGDFNDEINESQGNNSLWPLVNDPDLVYFTTTPIAGDEGQQSYPWYWNPSFLDHVMISSSLFDENAAASAQTLRIDDYTGSSIYQSHLSDHRPVIWRVPLAAVAVSEGLVINEIMNNPAAVSDTYGEWFEILNTSGGVIDLNGLIIRDDEDDSHTISQLPGLFLEPGEFLVLGREDDPALNGGVTIDYEYQNFNLNNTWDEVILQHPAGIVLDEVSYDNGATFPDVSGVSMMLVDPALDNSLGGNWQGSVEMMPSGDLGTPGAANSGAGCEPSGDANGDSVLDVTDLVIIVGYIIGDIDFTTDQICRSDVNTDDSINVVDLVIIVSLILSG